MLEMMQKMDPFMAPLFWTGAAFAMLAFVLLLARYRMKANTSKAVIWSSRVVIALGLFFVVAHFMGTYLGMDMPYINFGDPAKFEFIKGYFIVLGSVFLMAAVVLMKLASKHKRETVV